MAMKKAILNHNYQVTRTNETKAISAPVEWQIMFTH